jgi:hypothetical protein
MKHPQGTTALVKKSITCREICEKINALALAVPA